MITAHPTTEDRFMADTNSRYQLASDGHLRSVRQVFTSELMCAVTGWAERHAATLDDQLTLVTDALRYDPVVYAFTLRVDAWLASARTPEGTDDYMPRIDADDLEGRAIVSASVAGVYRECV